jgi:hypothetical protein
MIGNFIGYKVRGIQSTLRIWGFFNKFKDSRLISTIHVIFSKRDVFTKIRFKLLVLHVPNENYVVENTTLNVPKSVCRSLLLILPLSFFRLLILP